MVGERQSGLERDSRCEEDDAINTRQPNQSAPFTKILAEPMNQIQETSSFSASSKARWRYADLLPIHRKTLPTPARLRCIGSTFAARE